MGSNANEKKYHKHDMPRGFLRRRRLVSNTDRFVGGTLLMSKLWSLAPF
jgi:hypothetical protein